MVSVVGRKNKAQTPTPTHKETGRQKRKKPQQQEQQEQKRDEDSFFGGNSGNKYVIDRGTRIYIWRYSIVQ